MSYESPICVEFEKVARNIIEKQDSYIVQETQRITGVKVDKDELIKALQYDRSQYEKGYMDGEIDTLKRNTWIPCSERMPEEPFGCLVTVWDTDPISMDDFENLLPYFVGWDGEQWNDGDGIQCPFEVIAWMPLPLPYKEADK